MCCCYNGSWVQLWHHSFEDTSRWAHLMTAVTQTVKAFCLLCCCLVPSCYEKQFQRFRAASHFKQCWDVMIHTSDLQDANVCWRKIWGNSLFPILFKTLHLCCPLLFVSNSPLIEAKAGVCRMNKNNYVPPLAPPLSHWSLPPPRLLPPSPAHFWADTALSMSDSEARNLWPRIIEKF